MGECILLLFSRSFFSCFLSHIAVFLFLSNDVTTLNLIMSLFYARCLNAAIGFIMHDTCRLGLVKVT